MVAERIAARVAHLQREKRRLKGLIASSREQLHSVAAELTALEAECRRHGIDLVFVNSSSGEGARIHGHHDERTRA